MTGLGTPNGSRSSRGCDRASSPRRGVAVVDTVFDNAEFGRVVGDSCGVSNWHPADVVLKRIVFVGGPIDDNLANLVIAQLLFLERQDPDRDVDLYINSPGGSGSARLAMYDTMQLIRPPVAATCADILARTLEHLQWDDPIPSGVEPVDQSLNTSQQGLALSTPSLPPGESDLSPYLTHVDIRDDRVSLFAASLPPGTYTYSYLAQATTAGRYAIAPTRAGEAFFPEVFGRGAGTTLTVTG